MDFPLTRQRSKVTAESEQILAIYQAYPRKVARLAALKAIAKAVTYLAQWDGISPIEARRKLYKATLLYARSPDGQNPDRTKIPHPATWYNRGSYLDDPKEWHHGGFSNGSVPASKADRNMGVLAKILGEGKHPNSSNQDGEFQAGEHGRNQPKELRDRS
jgi:hypothetical protein